jgi:hypothetical protein
LAAQRSRWALLQAQLIAVSTKKMCNFLIAYLYRRAQGAFLIDSIANLQSATPDYCTMYFDKSLKQGLLTISAELQDWRHWFNRTDVRATNENNDEGKNPRPKSRLMDGAQRYRERRAKGFDAL